MKRDGEYWMIDSEKQQIVVQQFASSEEEDDSIRIYGFQDKVPVQIYGGDLQIDFENIPEAGMTGNALQAIKSSLSY